jgi:uncharacterized protein (TIGR00251 family)
MKNSRAANKPPRRKTHERKRITIIVKPNSKSTEITSYNKESDTLHISLKSSATENKANLELLKFIKKQTKRN